MPQLSLAEAYRRTQLPNRERLALLNGGSSHLAEAHLKTQLRGERRSMLQEAMSRKHFQGIARAIRSTKVDDNAKDAVALAIAEVLSGINPNFNLDRFMADAVGYQPRAPLPDEGGDEGEGGEMADQLLDEPPSDEPPPVEVAPTTGDVDPGSTRYFSSMMDGGE